MTLVDNEHSTRLGLYGDYILHVTSTALRLVAPKDSANNTQSVRYEWRLRSLMRFAVVETENDADINRLFVIFAGPYVQQDTSTKIVKKREKNRVLGQKEKTRRFVNWRFLLSEVIFELSKTAGQILSFEAINLHDNWTSGFADCGVHVFRSALKGAGNFRFLTTDAGKVLHCIHETIDAALASRNQSEAGRQERSQSEPPEIRGVAPRRKLLSESSATSFRSAGRGATPQSQGSDVFQSRQHSLPAARTAISFASDHEHNGGNRASVCVMEQPRATGSGASGSAPTGESQSTHSGSPSPQTNGQHWKNYFPAILSQPDFLQLNEVNRSTSVSSTGSRDSGVVLDSSSGDSGAAAGLRANADDEGGVHQNDDRLSELRDVDTRWRHGLGTSRRLRGHSDDDVTGADLLRSRSFTQVKHRPSDAEISHDAATGDQRRFTCGEASGLRLTSRKKKISDIYIDLDSILAAKAELDSKRDGSASRDAAAAEVDVPPPLPPFPPTMKPLLRKSVALAVPPDSAEEATTNIQRSRRLSRSRKLSTTSNIYFEVGSVSDLTNDGSIDSACELVSGEICSAEANSDGEGAAPRDRKVSHLYLDLDTVALLRAESRQGAADVGAAGAPSAPEPPPPRTGGNGLPHANGLFPPKIQSRVPSPGNQSAIKSPRLLSPGPCTTRNKHLSGSPYAEVDETYRYA